MCMKCAIQINLPCLALPCCNLWRSLLERPPPVPESWVRDPLGVMVWTRGGYTCPGASDTNTYVVRWSLHGLILLVQLIPQMLN